ncbi:hypothetical protein J7432_11820, partial [Xanthomonas axonopodis pv. begoniae]|nr:hypothetical protein [Xanthomonas axonopodis pv. begoniae]
STRPWGLGGGIHAANGPAIGEGTAPDSLLMTHRKRGISELGQFAALVAFWALDRHSMCKPTG